MCSDPSEINNEFNFNNRVCRLVRSTFLLIEDLDEKNNNVKNIIFNCIIKFHRHCEKAKLTWQSMYLTVLDGHALRARHDESDIFVGMRLQL
jgi:hypothetical protein